MNHPNIENLLADMTLKEKAGQLRQKLYGFSSYEIKDGKVIPAESFKEDVNAYGGMGFLYGLFRSDPWSGKDHKSGLKGKLTPQAYNAIQHYVMENTRLGIPVMVTCEAPHGNQMLDGFVMPVNLSVGATFDPELLRVGTKIAGSQLKASGSQVALMSMLDILRDPRWGRSEECYSEDPYLASRMAEAAVMGMNSAGVMCCSKHFAAQGQTTGGVNASAASIGERELREIHLPAAGAAVKAGCGAIMAAYNEIDGIPCHANPFLLKDILRGEMGFDGLVMADGVALDRLLDICDTYAEAAALALKAGVDVGLWDKTFDYIEDAVKAEPELEKLVDRAVLRVLRAKEKAGLFEKPFIEENDKYAQIAYSGEAVDISTRMAEESVVLLENDGILPLKVTGKILLAGPALDDVYRMLGDYTPYMDREKCASILDGIRDNISEDKLFIWDGKSEVPEGVELAILALGGSSSRFKGANFDTNGAALEGSDGDMECGEGMDLASLELSESQKKLVNALADKNIPIVSIVVAGRPYIVKEIKEKSNALLYAFYPGPLGGRAIGDIIFGKVSPSGLLPVSLPRSVGQLPVYYNHRISYEAMKYSDEPDQKPLYSFGYGLSYTDFEYSDVKVAREDGLKVTCKVTNKRKMDADDVLLLYVSRKPAGAVPRVKELAGFARVYVPAGKSIDVSIKCEEASEKLKKVSLACGRGTIEDFTF